jgi:hypothetical protein
VDDSPIEQFLRACDALDLEAATALFSPRATLVTNFDDRAEGAEQVRGELEQFFAGLRGTRHRVESAWHPEPDVWIAELTATYELTDFSERGPYRRVVVARADGDGITDMRIYGAHELPLSEAGRGYEEVRGPHGWLPTL